MPIELPTSVPTNLAPLQLAMFWAGHGFRVLPVDATHKRPIMKEWQKRASNNLDEIAEWPEWGRPGVRVGLATGPGSFDAYDEDVADGKPGTETRRRLFEAGLLAAGGHAIVKTPSGGRHYWGVGTSQRNGGRSQEWGADYRGEGGQVLAPGNPGYEWVCGPEKELARIDWNRIVEFLSPAPAPQQAATQPQLPAVSSKLTAPLPPEYNNAPGEESPAEWYNARTNIGELLVEHGWQPAGASGPNVHYTRPGKKVIDGISASVAVINGREVLNVKSTSTAFVVDRGHSAFETYAVLVHGGDRRAAASTIRRAMMPQRVATPTAPAPPPANLPVVVRQDAPPAQPVAPVASSGGELEQAPILLPNEFFDGCPELEIIRQAAYSRYVSPTALAMTVLTRIAAMADHKLRLPALVGSHVGLSFYTVLTAAVGGGKSSTVNLAAELLGQDPTSTRQVEVINGNGTGEGLLQKHMEMIKEEGAKHPVPVQTVHNVFWYVDEGMNLVNEFERRGSNAAGILCTGWFNAANGNNNATGELNRTLGHLSYNWGILIAIQDGNAHHLLARQGIGLTQRCFWVSGNDPTIPDPDHRPEWPGTLDWRHPALPGEVPAELRGRLSAPVVDEGAPRHVVLPTWYRREMEWGLWEQKAKGKVDELSEHIRLMEIKLSVLIGMLRGRLDPTDDDIRRARLAIGAHRKQIRRAASRTRLAEAENERLQAQKSAERAETRAEELVQRFRGKVTDAVSGGKTATWRQLRDKMRGAVRKEMGGDEALADIVTEMIGEGLVKHLGGEGTNTVYGAGDALGT